MHDDKPFDAAALLPVAPTFTRAQALYVWLAATCVTCLLIADIVGIRLFRYEWGYDLLGIPGFTGFQHTCGMLTFPVTFLITDLLTEYYGRKAARRVTYIGCAMAFLTLGVMQVSQAMPRWEVPFNVKEESFVAVLGSSQMMYIASVTAYFVGQMCDIVFFAWIKKMTGGRFIWLRATGSTVLSQMIDSFIVTWIAFKLGRELFPSPNGPTPMTWVEVFKTGATGYTLKFLLALAVTPLIYLGHGLMESSFGLRPLPPEQQR